MENMNLISLEVERQKREARRARLVMQTKDLQDYLAFRRWFREQEKAKKRKVRGL